MGIRERFAMAITTLFFLILGGRLFYVAVVAKDEIASKAENQIIRRVELTARRGDILDRNGSILASTTDAYRVDVDLATLRRNLERGGKSLESYAREIAGILGEEESYVLGRLSLDTRSAILKRKIEKSTADALRAYMNQENAGFLILGYDHIRYYPNQEFLAHVLGAVNVDGSGIMGLEHYYDEALRGFNGFRMVEIDKWNRELPFSEAVTTEPIGGSNLVLSIDERIQFFIEELAERAMEENESESISIIVSDPRTGEILGLVNAPDFNPNSPGVGRTQEEFNQITRNPAVNDTYEPGSTFKIITAAAALEERKVSEHEHFNCDGYIYVDGVRINCVNRSGHGEQTLEEILYNSCNPGMIQVVQRLGAETMMDYITRFHLGAKTGVDLPGEATGILLPLDRMKNVDLAAISIGQTNTLTPVQILAAMNAIANEGQYIPLHVGQKLQEMDRDGRVVREVPLGKTETDSVVSAVVADKVLHMAYNAVDGNPNSRARVDGFEVFGKTGTAQKIDPATGTYSSEDFIASFVGGAPYRDPKVTVVVLVDSPKPSIYGGAIAAPLAREIFLEVNRYIPLEVEQ